MTIIIKHCDNHCDDRNDRASPMSSIPPPQPDTDHDHDREHDQDQAKTTTRGLSDSLPLSPSLRPLSLILNLSLSPSHLQCLSLAPFILNPSLERTFGARGTGTPPFGHSQEKWEVLLGIRLLGTTFWHGFSNHQAATAQMHLAQQQIL